MDSILSTSTVIISPPSSTSTATSSNASATNLPHPTDYDIYRELDNFFANLFSALDVFAQVINLAYFLNPYSEHRVSFHRVYGGLRRSHPNDALTQYFTTLRTEQWHKDMKDFRKCAVHRKVIEFKIRISRESTQGQWETKIVLPDNPFLDQLTYSLNREFDIYGVDIFKRTVNAIDQMYSTMEARIRTANHIPV